MLAGGILGMGTFWNWLLHSGGPKLAVLMNFYSEDLKGMDSNCQEFFKGFSAKLVDIIR